MCHFSFFLSFKRYFSRFMSEFSPPAVTLHVISEKLVNFLKIPNRVGEWYLKQIMYSHE